MPKKYAFTVHPAVAYQQAVLANLEGKTGRGLEAWLAAARKQKAPDRKALLAWLKAQGLGATQAAIIAERMGPEPHAFSEDTPEGYLKAAEAYVEALFSGRKAALRPVFETLMDAALALGPDIKVSPCKTMVPIYRAHVIAEIKPLASRIDFGLALGNAKATDRLQETGGFARKDRITHKVAISASSEVDAELKRWLKAAYERDAE
jgi:hypothetical protein